MKDTLIEIHPTVTIDVSIIIDQKRDGTNQSILQDEDNDNH